MSRRIFGIVNVDVPEDLKILLASLDPTMTQVLEIANGLRPIEELGPVYMRKRGSDV